MSGGHCSCIPAAGIGTGHCAEGPASARSRSTSAGVVSRVTGRPARAFGHWRRRWKCERRAQAKSDSRPQIADDSVSRFPLQRSSRLRRRRDVRRTRRGNHTWIGRSSQTTVSADRSTRSPSLRSYVPSITQPSDARIGSSLTRSSSSGVSTQRGPWTSASSSTNGTSSRCASSIPRVVFPFPLALAMTATFRILTTAPCCRCGRVRAPCAAPVSRDPP